MDFMEILDEVAERKQLSKANIIAVAAVIVSVLLIAVLVLCLGRAGDENDRIKEEVDSLKLQLEEAQKIDVTYVGNKLESISELTTAKMTYNGIIHFTEGDIPLINKKEFHMAYRVSLKAGFDLSQVDIQVTEHTVTITLPEAEIYDPVVDEESFRFFDKTFGLFAHEEMDDLSQAISEAKADALAQPETQNMKETAKTQAITLITALFEGQIGGRELIVNVG